MSQTVTRANENASWSQKRKQVLVEKMKTEMRDVQAGCEGERREAL